MRTWVFAALEVFLVSIAMGANAYCQTRPATSGALSFYEPEPRPHGEGWYRPNMPGSPRVGSEVERPDPAALRQPR